jgi:hypothetical protein
MGMSDEPSLLDELLLLFLFANEKEGATLGVLRKEMKSLLDSPPADLASKLAHLMHRGLVTELQKKKGSTSIRWQLKPHGRDLIVKRLGGQSIQGRNWKQKAARTLGSARALKVDPKTAADIVHDDLLPEYFLAQRLGLEFHTSLTADGIGAHVAAAALETVNGKSPTLWKGLFRRALESQPSTSEPSEHQRFVEQINHTLGTANEGWFGEHKLFIHRAWETWRRETGETSDLATFKDRLLVALRAGHLGLARADFTETLNPADLEQAEIRDGEETFHFITR